MKIPRITRDSLLDVEQSVERWSEAYTRKFMEEQPDLCRFAYELIEVLGWTMAQFTAAMTICRIAFDALEHQMPSLGSSPDEPPPATNTAASALPK